MGSYFYKNNNKNLTPEKIHEFLDNHLKSEFGDEISFYSRCLLWPAKSEYFYDLREAGLLFASITITHEILYSFEEPHKDEGNTFINESIYGADNRIKLEKILKEFKQVLKDEDPNNLFSY